MKKFIDINNLKTVWEEINKRFIRSSEISERLQPLDELVFKSTLECQLLPNSEWVIDQSLYEEFLEFVNSNNIKKYVQDTQGSVWSVVNNAFYDVTLGSFTGIILSSNTNDGDVYFWYMSVSKNHDDEYMLYWKRYIGEIPQGDYVTNSKYVRDINNLNTIISDLSKRVAALDNGQSEYPENNPSPNFPDKETSVIYCNLIDINGAQVTGAKVFRARDIHSIGDKTYADYPGSVDDVLNVTYNKTSKLWEFEIVHPYAVEVTFRREGYEDEIVFAAYDTVGQVRAIMTPVQNDDSTPKPGTN